MFRTFLFVANFVALSFATSDVSIRQSPLPTLNLPWGTYQAQEFVNDTNIYLFRNVRFGAEPPRFAAPAFPTWANSSIQSSSDGRSCIQIKPEPNGKAVEDVPEGEDCLFADIYVPKHMFTTGNAAPLPVVVWLYGGAYSYGSKEFLGPLYTGQSLLAASNYNTIFVTGNYRLGAFGWLAGDYMQKVGQPNAGLYDQALLFEFVQKYITNVHGDPGQVSAFGESAGASSIMHHLVRENGTVNPTFNTFAALSPAYQWSWDNSPNGTMDQVYQNVSRLAGCGAKFDINCLKAAKNLTAVNQAIYDSVLQATGLYPWGPSVDGKWITTMPTIAFANGQYWKTINSTIISHVTREAVNFVPANLATRDGVAFFLQSFLPGEKLQSVRDQIKKQYCSSVFQAWTWKGCLENIIQDSSFVCNTRYLFDAYPEKSHMMSFAIPEEDFARHGVDLVAMFANSKAQADYIVSASAGGTLTAGLATFAIGNSLYPSAAPNYQTYFASFAATGGDPNAIRRPDFSGPRWPVGNGTADQVKNVLTVQNPVHSFDPFHWSEGQFVLRYDDKQNLRSTCQFWSSIADQIERVHRS